MRPDRRLVLKGLAAVGFAMASLRLAHAGGAASGVPASPARAGVTPLVAGSALDAEFLAGVHAAAAAQGLAHNPAIRMRGLDAAVFTRLGDMLQGGEPATLVGLADTASATLVLDLVRSAGGRVLSMRQHRLIDSLQGGPAAQALGSGLVLTCNATDLLPGDAGVDGSAYVSFCCVI